MQIIIDGLSQSLERTVNNIFPCIQHMYKAYSTLSNSSGNEANEDFFQLSNIIGIVSGLDFCFSTKEFLQN